MKPGPRIILVLEGKFPLETLSERVELRTLLLHDLEPDNIPLNLTFARQPYTVVTKHNNITITTICLKLGDDET